MDSYPTVDLSWIGQRFLGKENRPSEQRQKAEQEYFLVLAPETLIEVLQAPLEISCP